MTNKKLIYWNSFFALAISALLNIFFMSGDIKPGEMSMLLAFISATIVMYTVLSIIPIVTLIDPPKKSEKQ